MKLEKSQILTEAFALLNDVGIDKFNLRSLANRLSVSATALYWHFKNKDELIGAMAKNIYDNTYEAIDHCDDWRLSLTILGRTLRKEMDNYRDSVRMIASAAPTVVNSGQIAIQSQKISSSLVKNGLQQHIALQYEAIVISFVLGWMSYYQNTAYNKYLSEMFNFEKSFDIGLDSLICGFEQQQNKSLSNSPAGEIVTR
mgnify:CR=1 FL=1